MENKTNGQEEVPRLSIAELKQMKPVEVLENEKVRNRFVSLYNETHESKKGELFFEQEKYNLQRMIQANKDLSVCTGFSIYGVIMDVATMGITLENKSRPLLYILPGSVNMGTKDAPLWEKRASIEISPYGEMDLRIQAGQLLYADHPVIVYEGDEFKPKVTETGQKVVVYSASIPRQSKNIIGAFIKLTRPDKSFDFFWMLPEDIERLKGYSEKKNRGTANALYGGKDGQIDTGFLEAKVIKHSFKTFPKLKLRQFSAPQQEPIQASDYGLDEPVYDQTPMQTYNEPEDDIETQLAAAKKQGGINIVDNPDEPF